MPPPQTSAMASLAVLGVAATSAATPNGDPIIVPVTSQPIDGQWQVLRARGRSERLTQNCKETATGTH